MGQYKIYAKNEFIAACPAYSAAMVTANVINSEHNIPLWSDIEEIVNKYRGTYTTESIKDISAIRDARLSYKACGVEPSRYRPSAESLCRRVIRGLDLYRVNTLVDIINIVSMKTGLSMGAYDMNNIAGDEIVIGLGEGGEQYNGIGKGYLNITNMPVMRDFNGAFGTPTSDSTRTMVSLSTKGLLVIIHGFGGADGLQEAVQMCNELLTKYASASDLKSEIIRPVKVSI